MVTIRPEPKTTDSFLEVELAHLANGTLNPHCVLWDDSKTNESLGTWSTQGCKTVLTNASHMKCLRDRLSTFAILAQQPRERFMESSSTPSVTLIVGSGLSCLALITLAVVYAALWRYICSKRSIILINFCLSVISSLSPVETAVQNHRVLYLLAQTQTLIFNSLPWKYYFSSPSLSF